MRLIPLRTGAFLHHIVVYEEKKSPSQDDALFDDIYCYLVIRSESIRYAIPSSKLTLCML